VKDKLPKSPFLLLVAAIMAVFIAKLYANIVNVALPVIAAYFRVGSNRVSWVVLAYLLVSTAVMLLAGKLEDRYGLRKVFLLGYLLFAAGSLLGGLAPGFYFLVPACGLQGLGSALLVTSAFALIPRCLPEGKTAWAFGLLSTFSALGVALGAPLGGIVAGFLSWRWVFLLILPLALLAFRLARKNMPKDEPAQNFGAPDWPGAALSLAFLSLLVLALSLGREIGWGHRLIQVSLILSGLLFLVFLGLESRRSNPLFDLKLLKLPAFSFGVLASFFTMSFMSGSMFLLPFYLQDLKGLTVPQTGLVMMIPSGIYVLEMLILSPYLDRFISRWPCVVSMLGIGAACCFFAFNLGREGLFPLYVYLVIYGIFLGFFIAPNNNIVMCSLPRGREGEGSGLFQTLNSLGLVAGVCLFEAAFAHFIPSHLISAGLKNLDPQLLKNGFSLAFGLGGAACFASAGLSWMGVKPGGRAE